MRVVGVTLVANAVRLDFPVLPAIRSILPLCEEVVVNVGPSEDDTRGLIASLGGDRVRILDGVWDRSQGGGMLAVETQRALDAARGDWAVYVQADEVLHEDGIPKLRAALDAAHGDPRVEGLLCDYVHFYSAFDRIGTNRRWYRREVRLVRLGIGVVSHGDAQGFRVGAERRRVRARRTGAVMFHYGWARPPEVLRRKRQADAGLFGGRGGPAAEDAYVLNAEYGLRDFRGRHPEAVEHWVRARAAARTPLGPMRWDRQQLRFALSDWIERLTGWEPFVHRNYVEV